MNSTKTEFILLGSKGQLQKCTTNSINVNDVEVKHDSCIRYLGALLDAQLNMVQHINAKCRSAMMNLFKIKQIRHMVTREAYLTVVFWAGTVTFGFSNAILANLPANAIHKRKRVQNIAACVLLQDEQEPSTTKCLQKLPWLPIKQWIKFKILTLVYKCIND